VDLIPSRFSRISWLFRKGAISIDMAVIQISPPDENGYANLVGLDVERQAMASAKIVVGEISHKVPRIMGDTLVHVDEFNNFIETEDTPLYLGRWPVTDIYMKIADNIASIVEDGSCISFGIGPMYEALGKTLAARKNLGIHSPLFTDALMDLVKSGAVTNRMKCAFRGKSSASYVLGTEKLMKWLDKNPLVEFQPQDVIMDPKTIGQNDNVVAILTARKVDLTGNVALHEGKGNLTAGTGNVQELLMGSTLSRNGRNIFALSSRNLRGMPNILISVDKYPFQFTNRESMDLVVTEYGVARLMGKTMRQRAQALIEIAHPDDRAELVLQAKEAKMIYADQIFFDSSRHLYRDKVAHSHTFKDGLNVRFRAIKPSDEDDMRRLFYRFSDQSVYYRYFSPIKTMPHNKMQEYVNVDYRRTMSIVGTVEESGVEKIIAEVRYVRMNNETSADTAFIVDESYQGKGIASYLFDLLMRIAREEGIVQFTADVLADNKAMLKVYEKAPFPLKAVVSSGVYELVIPFKSEADVKEKKKV
jgi:acyl-CoA hydrolase/predicted GNAT family acetyltransferase